MHLNKFKRFEDLTITSIPPTARLVVVTGSNGSGKSAILEAINQYRRMGKFGWNGQDEYFKKVESLTPGQAPTNLQVEITLAEGPKTPEELTTGIWVRPAYRHQSDFRVQGVQTQASPADDPGLDRLITPDALVGGNYSRLLSNSVANLFDTANREMTAGEIVDKIVGSLQRAMQDIFQDLQLDNLVDPLGEGTFNFSKGLSRHFPFKNLSAGERAAFDILLDLIVRGEVVDDLLYAIDEPELHLGSGVQSSLLDAMLRLLPGETSQLWIATHSLGMMKRALELHQQNPASVAFLDTYGVEFDVPAVLQPIQPTRAFWRRSLEVALDDFAALVAPDQVVLCEGAEIEDGFDAACYRAIFEQTEPGVEFLSTGNSFEVKNDKRGVGAAIQLLAPGTKVTKLVDRDDLSIAERTTLEKEGTRVLSRRNIESYLLSEEVIRALYLQHGSTQEQAQMALEFMAQEQLKAVSERGRAVDDLKPIAPNMRVYLCRKLGLTERGSSFSEFARNELIPLITSETQTYRLLHDDIFGPPSSD